MKKEEIYKLYKKKIKLLGDFMFNLLFLWSKIIIIDKKFFRPSEVNTLKGNYQKAKRELKWKPQITLKQLVNEMVTFELKSLNEK